MNNPSKSFPLCLIILIVISFISLNIILFRISNSSSNFPEIPDEGITLDGWLNIEQDDPRLTRYIRKHHIFPPSTLPYNLTRPDRDYGDSVAFYRPLKILLQNQTGGFFIEAGSNDGEFASTTLGLERFQGWTGLCVEPSPIEQVNWKSKHRRSWFADVCLSPVHVPLRQTFLHRVGYSIASQLGSIGEVGSKKRTKKKKNWEWTEFNVTCFPVGSLLAALEVKVVDVFNLDVEGVEFEVLKTIPFEKVLIRIFTVELHWPSPALTKALKNFMRSKGYVVAWERSGVATPEYLFTHHSVSLQPLMPKSRIL